MSTLACGCRGISPCPLLTVPKAKPLNVSEAWVVWGMVALQFTVAVPIGFVVGWAFFAGGFR